jgi:prefoldin alpha subunit
MSNDDERVNALLTEVRVLESTFNELSARQNILERALLESRAAIDTISDLESSKTDEVLIPLGGGVLVRSSPPNSEKVLINIGANVVVEKRRETVIEVMEKRAQEFEQNIIAILNQSNQIAQRLEADRQALQVYVARQQQQPPPRR